MRREEIITDNTHLVRVSIRKARTLHDKGATLVLVPYLMEYRSPWYSEIFMYRDDDFDKFLNEFCYYNRTLNGNHNPKFYVRAKEI